jgi:hypothetical protein
MRHVTFSGRALGASLALALACTSFHSAAAQGPVQLNDLKTPTSPAFVLLGITPTAVERPTTPRAFALGLLSASQDGGSLFPENYATEVAPYWLTSHPDLTFDDYYRSRSVWQRVQQTFSVSLATTNVVEGADSTPAIGAGFRLSPFVGHATRRVDSLVTDLSALQLQIVRLRAELADAPAADRPGIQARIDALRNTSGGLSSQIRTALASDDERVGFRMQLAGGLAAFYPGNNFSGGKIGRTGLWGTVAYRLERPSLDVIALTRFQRNEEETEQDVWDFGGRAVFLNGPFAASMEWVTRSASDAAGDGPGGESALDSGNRVVGMLEYRATDDLFLSFSFGQDHPRVGEEGQPLVAILGGQFNFGSKPTINLP